MRRFKMEEKSILEKQYVVRLVSRAGRACDASLCKGIEGPPGQVVLIRAESP
jgi:hypothetical protein